MKTGHADCRRIALQIEKSRAHGRALLRGIADYALERTDWRLELVEPERLVRPSYLAQFDGLIVRVMDDRTAAALVQSGKPVVDTYGRIDRNPLESIRLDDAILAKMAYDCFAEHHYRSFAYCGFDGLRFSEARGEAFREQVEGNGGVCSLFRVPERMRIGDTFFRDEKTDVPDARALRTWLKSLPKPTAVFCCNDLRAVQVLKVCADCGLKVPEDLAVLGADNDVLLCTFASPSLSSIETDPFALGRTAAEMLDRQMQGKPNRRKASAGLAPVLHRPKRAVERSSTDSYPFRIPWLVDAVRYIRRNVADGVTADDVVRMVGYSHPKVNQAFAQELGHSIKKEILHQRIRLACAMLRNTDLPSSAVAVRCGYRSPQYFSHCFIGEFGMTPELWRKDGAFQETQSDFQ